MKSQLIIFLALAIISGSCNTEKTPLQFATDNLALQYEIIRSDGFHVDSTGTQIYRDQGEWNLLWENYWSILNSSGEKTLPPSIDFSGNMVIAIFYGEQSSACQNLDDVIKSVIKKSDRLEVELGAVNLEGPCDFFSWPSIMLKVEKLNLPVVFIGEVPD